MSWQLPSGAKHSLPGLHSVHYLVLASSKPCSMYVYADSLLCLPHGINYV
jgi:hypothetical protein